MALQVYRCPEHGEFDVNVPLTQDVPPTAKCTQPICPANAEGCDGKGRACSYCSLDSPWVLKAPGAVTIKGSRGDHGLDRDAQQLAGEKLKAKQRR